MTFAAPLAFDLPVTVVPVQSTFAAADATTELVVALMLPPVIFTLAFALASMPVAAVMSTPVNVRSQLPLALMAVPLTFAFTPTSEITSLPEHARVDLNFRLKR